MAIGSKEDGFAVVVGTCDTKFEDLDFIRSILLARRVPVKLVDVAGPNAISRIVLGNAAYMLAGAI